MSEFNFIDGNGLVPAHRHPNGGGWVSDCSYVADTVYVGPHASVTGGSSVFGNARVEDFAMVSDRSEVRGRVVLSGVAEVTDGSHLSGSVVVRDGFVSASHLSGAVVVGRRTSITANSCVGGEVSLVGNYQIIGDSWIFDKRHVASTIGLTIYKTEDDLVTIASGPWLVYSVRGTTHDVPFTELEMEESWELAKEIIALK